MALDPNIILQAKPVQFDNPMNQLAKIAELQSAQSQNQIANLKFSEAQREISDNKLIGDAHKNALGPDGKSDRNKLYTAIAQGGLGAKLPAIQKAFAEQDKATADLDKVKQDGIAKRLEIAGQAFGYVRNNPTLDAANSVLDYLGQNGVYSPEQVAQYKAKVSENPAAIKQLADQAFQSVLSAKEQLPTFQTRNTGGSTDTLEMNPVTGGVKVASSVKNTMTPGEIATDARGRDSNAISRERLNFDKNAPKGQYDAERGLVVDPRTGTAKAVTGPDGVPLGAKDAKPTADYLKQAEAYQNMDDAITGYKAVLTKFGKLDTLNPSKRAEMGTAYQNTLLQAKEIYKLGVLNGPDKSILEAIINNPVDLNSTLVPKGALLKQADDLQAIVKRGNENLGKINKQKVTPLNSQTAAPAPASSGPKPGAVMDGYRFKGGNPADKNAWEKM